MGGTWVHWNQPHVWHAMHRYGLTQLLSSAPGEVGFQKFTVSVDGKKIELSRHEEVSEVPSGYHSTRNRMKSTRTDICLGKDNSKNIRRVI